MLIYPPFDNIHTGCFNSELHGLKADISLFCSSFVTVLVSLPKCNGIQLRFAYQDVLICIGITVWRFCGEKDQPL